MEQIRKREAALRKIDAGGLSLISAISGLKRDELQSARSMKYTEISPTAQALAQRLLAFEVASEESTPKVPAVFIVSEKLRNVLSTLIGSAGFRGLLMRALTLARRKAPSLDGVHIKDDGSLERVTGEEMEEDAVLIAHLVGLLETFIGQPLTLKLLNDIWPHLSRIETNSERNASI